MPPPKTVKDLMETIRGDSPIDVDMKSRSQDSEGQENRSTKRPFAIKENHTDVQKTLLLISVGSQELAKSLLVRQRDSRKASAMLGYTELLLEESKLQENILQIKLNIKNWFENGQSDRDQPTNSDQALQSKLEDEAKSLEMALDDIRYKLQERDGIAINEQNAVETDIQSKTELADKRIGELSKLIEGIDEQEDIHQAGDDDDRAYQIMHKLVNELPKVIESLSGQEQEIEQIRSQTNKLNKELKQRRNSIDILMQQISVPFEDRAKPNMGYRDLYHRTVRSLIIHLSLRLEEMTKDLMHSGVILSAIQKRQVVGDLQTSIADLQNQIIASKGSHTSNTHDGQKAIDDHIQPSDDHRLISAIQDVRSKLDQASACTSINKEMTSLKHGLSNLEDFIQKFEDVVNEGQDDSDGGHPLVEHEPAQNDRMIERLVERLGQVKRDLKDKRKEVLDEEKKMEQESDSIVDACRDQVNAVIGIVSQVNHALELVSVDIGTLPVEYVERKQIGRLPSRPSDSDSSRDAGQSPDKRGHSLKYMVVGGNREREGTPGFYNTPQDSDRESQNRLKEYEEIIEQLKAESIRLSTEISELSRKNNDISETLKVDTESRKLFT